MQIPPKLPEIQEMWQQINLKVVDTAYPQTENFAQHLRALYVNGKVVFKTFAFDSNPTWEYFARIGDYHRMGFFRDFWKQKSVKQFYHHPLHKELNEYSHELFSHTGTLHLGASCASALIWGGAYEEFKPRNFVAKAIGEALEQELVGNRYEDIRIYSCMSGWSRFFYDVAWDYTWIIIDEPQKLIHVILAIDTD